MGIYDNFNAEDFGKWVFDMDDKLESFTNSLFGDIKTRLDYSFASLSHVEQWLVTTYKTPAAVDALHRAIPVDGFCRYIGETFRKALGGYWDMAFDGDGGQQVGPYLTGSVLMGKTVAPYQLIKDALAAKSTTFMQEFLLQLKHSNSANTSAAT